MKLSLNPNDYLKADGRELFLFSIRWGFGFWFLFVGLSKWIGGYDMFLSYIAKEFAQTWVPPILTSVLGWVILILEPLLGALLMIGWRPRLIWIVTGKVVFMLMLGKTILGDWNTVAHNWIYILLCFGAAALEDPEEG